MVDLNLAVVTGTATKDAVRRHRTSGISKVEFSLEVKRPFLRATGEAVADLFWVDVYGTLADRCAEEVRQGTRLLLVGTLSRENHSNRHGRREYVTVIKAKYLKALKGNASGRDGLPVEHLRGDQWEEGTIIECLKVTEGLMHE